MLLLLNQIEDALVAILNTNVFRFTGLVVTGKRSRSFKLSTIFASISTLSTHHVHANNEEQPEQPIKHLASPINLKPHKVESSIAKFQRSSSQSGAGITFEIQVQSTEIAFDADVEVLFEYPAATSYTFIAVFPSTADTSTPYQGYRFTFLSGNQYLLKQLLRAL